MKTKVSTLVYIWTILAVMVFAGCTETAVNRRIGNNGGQKTSTDRTSTAIGNQSDTSTISTTTVDTSAPTVGAFSASSAVGATSFTLNWAASTDSGTASSSLLYLVCSGVSATAIDTVGECEASTQELAYTANMLTLEISGKLPSTTYYYNVVVKDAAGNKAAYAGKAQPTLVTTSSNAERSGTVRHSFYDTVNSKHWQFYIDGSTVKSQYSTDAVTWFGSTNVSASIEKFTLHYKSIAGTGYVFLVSEENSYDIVLRRGALSSTSITWNSSITIFDGTSSSNLYKSPAITTDDSNVWVAAAKYDGFNWATQARQSTNASDANLNAWDAATTLGSLSTVSRHIALLPRGGESIYALYQDGLAVVGYEFAAGSWSLASTGGDNAWFTLAGPLDLKGNVLALASTGSDLYVGGDFTYLAGIKKAARIAKWNGSSWSALGSGLNNNVTAIAVSGTDIYVGGSFTDAGGIVDADRIAKWNGTSWSALGSGLNGAVSTVVVSGSELYVGGQFTDGGGNTNADYVAKWDGTAWSALGSGLNSSVNALVVSAGDLYAGGLFTDAGGITSADYIAKWDGTSWSALATGLGAYVSALAVSGSDLYVGGNFTDAGGNTSADFIAKWNGTGWLPLGSGLNTVVSAILVSGSDVYAGGSFTNAGGNAGADYIAKWNGANWSALGAGTTSGAVWALALLGTDLCIGGSFSIWDGGNNYIEYLSKWNGSSWTTFGSGIGDMVYSLAVLGSNLFVGGVFTNLGANTNADFIAKWDGASWTALGSGLNDTVLSLVVIGSDLYAGGLFTDAGGDTSADYVAKWNGSAWSALGPGLTNDVYAMAVSGTDLYVGGRFSDAGGNPNADKIARWNGTAWSALGTGIGGTGRVYSLAIAGTDVYAGGTFNLAGGVAINRIAKWNGTAWSALGAGLNAEVDTIAINGADVYAGGQFTDAGGNTSASYIAKWDGTSWTALGSGMSMFGYVYALSFSGSDLYAGGIFANAGGSSGATGIAKWNGSSWSPVFSGSEGETHRSILVDGGLVYIGYDRGVNILKPAVVGSVANFSAAANDLNNPFLLYIDSIGAVKTKTLAGGTWSAATTLYASGGTVPVLSAVAGTSNLAAFWFRDGAFEYKKYDGSSWDTSPVTLVSTSDAARFPTCDLSAGGGLIKCIVTTLSTAPFDIRTWTLAL